MGGFDSVVSTAGGLADPVVPWAIGFVPKSFHTLLIRILAKQGNPKATLAFDMEAGPLIKLFSENEYALLGKVMDGALLTKVIYVYLTQGKGGRSLVGYASFGRSVCLHIIGWPS